MAFHVQVTSVEQPLINRESKMREEGTMKTILDHKSKVKVVLSTHTETSSHLQGFGFSD